MFKIVKTYSSNNIIVEDEESGYYEVTLKWDGCIDFRRGCNGFKPSEDQTGENTDYIHICDIDEMIETLQELKKVGSNHFNNEFWN